MALVEEINFTLDGLRAAFDEAEKQLKEVAENEVAKKKDATKEADVARKKLRDTEQSLQDARDRTAELEEKLADQKDAFRKLEDKLHSCREQLKDQKSADDKPNREALAIRDSDRARSTRNPSCEKSPARSHGLSPLRRRKKSPAPSRDPSRPRSPQNRRAQSRDWSRGKNWEPSRARSRDRSPPQVREASRRRSRSFEVNAGAARRPDSPKKPNGQEKRSPSRRSLNRRRSRSRRCSRSRSQRRRPSSRSLPRRRGGGSDGKDSGKKWCFMFVCGSCRKGDGCFDRHPESSEVTRIKEQMGNKVCHNGKDCSRKMCLFKHPDGRKGFADHRDDRS